MPILTNPRHEKFAQLVASGKSATSSYVKAGYSPKGKAGSSTRLRAKAIVRQRIAEIVAEIAGKCVKASIREVDARINALQDRKDRMTALIEARAKLMAKVPGGGNTGMLVCQYKQVGSGKNSRLVKEYAFDAALVKELRAHEEQAVKELSGWTNKSEIKGSLTVDILDAVLDDDSAGEESGGSGDAE